MFSILYLVHKLDKVCRLDMVLALSLRQDMVLALPQGMELALDIEPEQPQGMALVDRRAQDMVVALDMVGLLDKAQLLDILLRLERVVGLAQQLAVAQRLDNEQVQLQDMGLDDRLVQGLETVAARKLVDQWVQLLGQAVERDMAADMVQVLDMVLV